jgi:hypothetical protein
MSERTPGPYVIDQRSDGLWSVRQEHAAPGAVEVHVALCQFRADAQTFAAAPDLLAACEAALCEIYHPHDPQAGKAVYDQMVTAIAKAKGEA